MAKKKKRNDGKKGGVETKAPAKKPAEPQKAADDDDDADEDEGTDDDESDEAASAEVSGPRPSASHGKHEDEDEDEDEDEAPARPAAKAKAKAAHAGHAAPTSHAAHAGEHHHKPDRKAYLRVWVYLFVLTVLEVGVAYLEKSIGKTAIVTALVGLALAKAACVALYYMHLSHESKFMRYTVAFPMVFPALYAFILIAEGAYRAIWGGT